MALTKFRQAKILAEYRKK